MILRCELGFSDLVTNKVVELHRLIELPVIPRLGATIRIGKYDYDICNGVYLADVEADVFMIFQLTPPDQLMPLEFDDVVREMLSEGWRYND